MTTVPGMSFPFVSATVKVSLIAADEELIVAGSIGWLKVAVTSAPDTTLSPPFMLVGIFVAPLPGLDEITVGSVAAPTRVPGATATPGAPAAKTPQIPPPASNAANNIDISTGRLQALSNLVIFISLRPWCAWPVVRIYSSKIRDRLYVTAHGADSFQSRSRKSFMMPR
jgi:hypothetical protein